jgi:hypothetical protein
MALSRDNIPTAEMKSTNSNADGKGVEFCPDVAPKDPLIAGE